MIKDRLKELQAVSSCITILFVSDMNKFKQYEKIIMVIMYLIGNSIIIL